MVLRARSLVIGFRSAPNIHLQTDIDSINLRGGKCGSSTWYDISREQLESEHASHSLGYDLANGRSGRLSLTPTHCLPFCLSHFWARPINKHGAKEHLTWQCIPLSSLTNLPSNKTIQFLDCECLKLLKSWSL